MAESPVWKIVRAAARQIPWVSVVENTPMLLELVERARERFRSAGSHDFHEELRLIHEENLKLADSLLQTSQHVQELTATLEVVVARQKTLAAVTVVSLLIAISSLVLWFVK